MMNVIDKIKMEGTHTKNQQSGLKINVINIILLFLHEQKLCCKHFIHYYMLK